MSNNLSKKMKPGEDKVTIDYELLINFEEGELEQFFKERGIVDIENYIRISYNIPLTEKLCGHFLVGTNNSVFVLFFKKNKIQYKKTQALDLTISLNVCMTKDNFEVIHTNDENEIVLDTEKKVKITH